MSARFAMFLLISVSVASFGKPIHQARPEVRQVSSPSDDQNFAEQLKVARFYFVHGNYKAAKARYLDVLSHTPDSSEALFGLARSQEKLGEIQKAKESFGAYLRAAPNGVHAAEARQTLGQLQSTK